MHTQKFRACLTIVLVSVIAGCAPTGGQVDSDIYGDLENLDPTGQVITFWHPHTGARQEALLALIDDFNTSNEWNISVSGENAGAYADIYDKIIAGISTGDMPELVLAYQSHAAIYAARNGIVELTPYIESATWGLTAQERADFFSFVERGDFLPQLGGRYGFAHQRLIQVLYYNAEWLTELGYPHPPRTWEAFREIACAATDPAASTYGYAFSVDPSTFVDMFANRGGQMINQDTTAYTFDSPAGLETLIFIQELLADGCAVMETERFGDRADFGASRALFTIGPSSGLSAYHSAVTEGAGFGWNVAMLPTTLEAPRPNVYGTSISIPRTTPERQLAAWLFVRWFTEPAQQARWASATGFFPVRHSTAEPLDDYFDENPQYAEAFRFLAYDATIEPAVAGYNICHSAIGDMLRAIARGGDAQAWLTETVEECNRHLDQ